MYYNIFVIGETGSIHSGLSSQVINSPDKAYSEIKSLLLHEALFRRISNQARTACRQYRRTLKVFFLI